MRTTLKHATRERKARPGTTATRPIEHSDFPEHQIKRLRAIGIDPMPRRRRPGAFDPVASYARHYEEIVATSLTTSQVAEHLHVSEGRIRQRLTSRPPTLYALSDPVLRAAIEESAARLGYDVRGVRDL